MEASGYARPLFLSSLILLIHLSSIVSSNKTTNNPYPFLTWDAGRIAQTEFDYIVVGGGAAGCPLAVTLSSQFSVLLLERGTSPFGNPDVERADAYSKPLSYADNYTSIAHIFTSEDGILNARARVLGGGTAINAGLYSRGSRKMVSSDMGLDEVLVNQSYHWIESKLVHKPRSLTTWSTAIKDALLGAHVYPYNGFTLDHVEGTKYSGSIFDETGRRHTAAELLDYANADNMMVLLNSTAGRVLFKIGQRGARPRAYGVEFTDRNGVQFTAMLNGREKSEVILCAGVLGSPQLLMLSGIGPTAHLKSLGIPVVVDSPAVGKGMADNPGTNVALQSSKPVEWSPLQIVGITRNSRTYLEGGSRYIETTRVYRGGLFQKVAFPKSKGEMWLKNEDPRENPAVRFNYYAHPSDLKTCVDGMRIQIAVFRSPVMQRFGYRNRTTGKVEVRYLGKSLPEDVGNLTVMEEHCRNSVVTIYHYHGGCGVGSVIDGRNRVKGVKRLRVVDGSTYKDSPGTNPQATTMMLGRYKALKIIKERE